jgi:hypothetical protein
LWKESKPRDIRPVFEADGDGENLCKIGLCLQNLKYSMIEEGACSSKLNGLGKQQGNKTTSWNEQEVLNVRHRSQIFRL